LYIILDGVDNLILSNLQAVALFGFGAEGFGLLNTFVVFHLLHDAIAGGIQMT
jgi:hypothetical protein